MPGNWHGTEVGALVRQGVMRGLAEGIGIVERRAVGLILDTPKTGRIYRRNGREHQASAPGEPFANDTGQTLANRTVSVDPDKLSATLTFRGENALRLEVGTRKMLPRPYARRALMESAADVSAAVRNAVAERLRR